MSSEYASADGDTASRDGGSAVAADADGSSGTEAESPGVESPDEATPGAVSSGSRGAVTPAAVADATDAPYVLRRFEPGDVTAFVDLYNEAFGGGSERWFRWKYLENPLVTHVPVVVADADGTLAGARPQVPFRMRVGERTVLAFRFGDTMVHPDHRRQGVFTALAEDVLAAYTETAPVFGFNCPNRIARGGFQKVGGHVVGELPSYYRIQNPRALAGRRDGTRIDRAASLAAPLVSAYNRGRDLTRPSPSGVRVFRHPTIPVDRLVSLYERAVPERIHAVRDEPFLSWRYRNPTWEYTAYTAERKGDDIAALVTGTRTWEGRTVTNVVDVLPLLEDGRRKRGLPALLAAVVKDHRDADVVAYCGETIPRSLLARFGFVGDDTSPVSRVASPSKLLTYDVSRGPAWTVEGFDLRDPESWLLTYTELDAR